MRPLLVFLFQLTIHFVQPGTEENDQVFDNVPDSKKLCYNGTLTDKGLAPLDHSKLDKVICTEQCTVEATLDNKVLKYNFKCESEERKKCEENKPCEKINKKFKCCCKENLCTGQDSIFHQVFMHFNLVTTKTTSVPSSTSTTNTPSTSAAQSTTTQGSSTSSVTVSTTVSSSPTSTKSSSESPSPITSESTTNEQTTASTKTSKQSSSTPTTTVTGKPAATTTESGSNALVLALALIGGAILLVAVAIIAWCCWRRYRQRKVIKLRAKGRRTKTDESGPESNESQGDLYDNISSRMAGTRLTTEQQRHEYYKRPKKTPEKAQSETASLGSADTDEKQERLVPDYKPNAIVTERTNQDMHKKQTDGGQEKADDGKPDRVSSHFLV